jgi:sulfopyruvate decarboxylase subunit alpha
MGLGVTHVVTIPDNTSAPVLDAIAAAEREVEERMEGGSTIRLIYATREGEAMGLASGLWMGGGRPVVLIQNTGLLEAGDGLRGTAARMGVPLLLLITCRGYAKARSLGLDPASVPVTRETLTRDDLDSVAHMTEATLHAWGIPFSYLRDARELGPLEEAWRRAREEERPVALLVDTTFDSAG